MNRVSLSSYTLCIRPCLFLISLCVITDIIPACANDRPEDKPPNIVLIISDDQAWTDFGFMGHPAIETPHLDQLASESLLFERGYVPTSLCCPSLVSILTGLYPTQHHISGNDPALTGEFRNKNVRRQRYLELDREVDAKLDALETLPKLLARKGYVSFQAGKWWHGSYENGGFTNGMTHGDPDRGGRHGDKGLEIGRKGLQPIFDFIDTADEKPFFVWYAPFLPHTPHNPPARLLEKYKDGRSIQLAKYFAMCEWFDETCGQLVDHVDGRGLAENTLFVFVTDNGWIQATPKTVKPEGWRKQFAPHSKQSPSEGGIRTPIFLRWKSRIAPSIDCRTLVSSVDLAPTILKAAGSDVPKCMTGTSLLNVSETMPLERNAVFGEIFAHDIADINDPSKSLMYRWCILDQQKLILHYDGKTGRYGSIHRYMQGDRLPDLFDLGKDPFEKENLYQPKSEEIISLKLKLETFFEGLPEVHK